MARTVSSPSQATVHLARKAPQELYYECLDEGEAWQFPNPALLYKIDMQARFAAARATVLQYTLQVPISKKTSSGAVHANVGQKLLIRYPFKSFLQ